MRGMTSKGERASGSGEDLYIAIYEEKPIQRLQLTDNHPIQAVKHEWAYSEQLVA